ncbi:uncharacterized protein LOC144865538 [Branchiostoma floridae x Branchiostoma japonicum]
MASKPPSRISYTRIKYYRKDDSRIDNEHPPYDGILIQYTRNGDPVPKVFRAPYGGNKPNEVVTVYSYTSIPPAADGTYVVLQFKETGMYFTSKRDEPGKLVLRKKGVFRPKDAEDITNPDDPRVFLMKPHQNSGEMLYQSVFASKKLGSSLVITVSEDPKIPAELEKEVLGTSEGMFCHF